ncbi:Acyl-CoA-binding domain-containing protein 2 [Apostasia shenzhenica]|uniref:Acyl-CoA-binding domain-containing protein 2 n=1 Tax=Apostasia shenzhenica TaxID=1088818 RepID=A0A2I0AZ09_9ASPA|nr:Acyl-CoA-binding domain-containing protein 2 [Apostasia shenzhenica]
MPFAFWRSAISLSLISLSPITIKPTACRSTFLLREFDLDRSELLGVDAKGGYGEAIKRRRDMELEFYQELILSAVFSVLFAFLIGKIAGAGPEDGNRAVDDTASSDVAVAASVEEKWERSAEEEAEAVSERAIAGGNEGREGKGAEADEIGGEGGNTDEMPEAVGSGRNSALLYNEGEGEEGDRDAERICSDVKDASREGVSVVGGEEVRVEKDGGSLLHGEDEWEGIERSDLEKLFGAATEYVGRPSGAEALNRLSNDVQMELYGLRKVATEGPCYESQPFPLKASARARWYRISLSSGRSFPFYGC